MGAGAVDAATEEPALVQCLSNRAAARMMLKTRAAVEAACADCEQASALAPSAKLFLRWAKCALMTGDFEKVDWCVQQIEAESQVCYKC